MTKHTKIFVFIDFKIVIFIYQKAKFKSGSKTKQVVLVNVKNHNKF